MFQVTSETWQQPMSFFNFLQHEYTLHMNEVFVNYAQTDQMSDNCDFLFRPCFNKALDWIYHKSIGRDHLMMGKLRMTQPFIYYNLFNLANSESAPDKENVSNTHVSVISSFQKPVCQFWSSFKRFQVIRSICSRILSHSSRLVFYADLSFCVYKTNLNKMELLPFLDSTCISNHYQNIPDFEVVWI